MDGLGMSAGAQQAVAFAIVALVALVVALKFFRSALAEPIARFLLKRGQVKWAMKLKGTAQEPGCNGCKH